LGSLEIQILSEPVHLFTQAARYQTIWSRRRRRFPFFQQVGCSEWQNVDINRSFQDESHSSVAFFATGKIGFLDKGRLVHETMAIMEDLINPRAGNDLPWSVLQKPSRFLHCANTPVRGAARRFQLGHKNAAEG